MNFGEYQARCMLTAVYPANLGLLYPSLGLAGEVGEVLNKIKKIFRDNDGFTSEEVRQALKDELGDVLWYLAVLSSELELPLEEIAEQNIEKLRRRHKNNTIHGSGDTR